MTLQSVSGSRSNGVTYLARVRLRIAAQLLKTTKRSVLDVACDVGYQSEAAFIRQ